MLTCPVFKKSPPKEFELTFLSFVTVLRLKKLPNKQKQKTKLPNTTKIPPHPPKYPNKLQNPSTVGSFVPANLDSHAGN